jgi:hypothetical protein
VAGGFWREFEGFDEEGGGEVVRVEGFVVGSESCGGVSLGDVGQLVRTVYLQASLPVHRPSSTAPRPS